MVAAVLLALVPWESAWALPGLLLAGVLAALWIAHRVRRELRRHTDRGADRPGEAHRGA
ncbi:MAG: hypothetical protein ACPGU7_03710 [Gammaproteobacteria bacterium]